MYARPTTLGILAAVAVALPGRSPAFTLRSSGAVQVRVAGSEARYGVVPLAVRGRPILAISLGADSGAGAVHLALPGDRLPTPGRYPIRSSWEAIGSDAAFHASFMAGTAGQPVGWFHGESGTVTITSARDGRLSGTFEVHARGFLGADPGDESRWVTVRGRFDAAGDRTSTTVASAR